MEEQIGAAAVKGITQLCPSVRPAGVPGLLVRSSHSAVITQQQQQQYHQFDLTQLPGQIVISSYRHST
jgi:hypothetical protein